MKTLFLILALAASAASQAQAPKHVTFCWTPEGGTETCQVLNPDSVTLVTFDLRQTPAQYVVVQPIPAYQLAAMQTHVSNQTYNMQQADGSLKTIQRYSSVQDLLVQNIIRNVVVPTLLLYPPTGDDVGKTTFNQAATDIKAATQVVLVP